MNRQRRKKLDEACLYLNRASNIVEQVKDEEQDCMDNIPESLQETDRFYMMDEAVDALQDALDSINEASESIEKARNGE